MAEWYRMTDAIKKAGYDPLVLGGQTFPFGHLVDALLATSATPAQFKAYMTNWRKGSDSSVKYSDPAFQRVLQTIVDWNKRGIFTNGFVSNTMEQGDALFMSGKVAMDQGGSWTAGIARSQKPSFGFGWFLYPPVRTSQPARFQVYAGNAWTIPVQAKNPDLARTFIEFLISKQTEETITPKYLIPSRSDVSPTKLKQLDPLVKQQLTSIPKFGATGLWGDTVPPELGAESTYALLQGLITGSETPKSVGAKLDTILRNLQQGKK
jgi:raffinose/stachyose/melibiose transport system substrate-binding protein